jgi:hypothetical protein
MDEIVLVGSRASAALGHRTLLADGTSLQALAEDLSFSYDLSGEIEADSEHGGSDAQGGTDTSGNESSSVEIGGSRSVLLRGYARQRRGGGGDTTETRSRAQRTHQRPEGRPRGPTTSAVRRYIDAAGTVDAQSAASGAASERTSASSHEWHLAHAGPDLPAASRRRHRVKRARQRVPKRTRQLPDWERSHLYRCARRPPDKSHPTPRRTATPQSPAAQGCRVHPARWLPFCPPRRRRTRSGCAAPCLRWPSPSGSRSC